MKKKVYKEDVFKKSQRKLMTAFLLYIASALIATGTFLGIVSGDTIRFSWAHPALLALSVACLLLAWRTDKRMEKEASDMMYGKWREKK